jgi:ABC-2 type transport system ATP-binding protein
MESVISVKNLSKEYITYKRGESFGAAVKSLFIRKKEIVEAVKNISFDIKSGEILGLLGENGAGKSTIIKMLTGVLFPTSGQATVLGYTPYTNRKKYVQYIGAVFGQKSQLIWDIPPIDSFALNKAIYGIAEDDYKKRLGFMIEMLGLSDVMEKPTRVLSLGERMKCEFIMAMLHGPKVVFLDEPTIGVDLIAKEAIRSFIRDMNGQGTTFILTTHDLEDVESLAQRVIIINNGEIVFEGSLQSLKMHLGDKKTVHIIMKNAVDVDTLINRDGITLLEQASDLEAQLLVDNSKIQMNEFISYLTETGNLNDISIKELGISTVIRSIYESNQ